MSGPPASGVVEEMKSARTQAAPAAGDIQKQAVVFAIVMAVSVVASLSVLSRGDAQASRSRMYVPRLPAECDVALKMREGVRARRRAPRSSVLLLSHGRSGSSLAALLFFGTTNVFYLDEPIQPYHDESRLAGLDVVDKAMEMIDGCRFGRGYASGGEEEDPNLEYEFVKWERGRYKHVLAGLPGWMKLDESVYGQNINNNSNFKKNAKGRRNSKLLLPRMEDYCERAQITAMKEIRLTFPTGPNPRTRPCAAHMVSNIDYVLDKYESAKIIHLVRHPAEVRIA